jgi:hypothetical protein
VALACEAPLLLLAAVLPLLLLFVETLQAGLS